MSKTGAFTLVSFDKYKFTDDDFLPSTVTDRTNPDSSLQCEPIIDINGSNPIPSTSAEQITIIDDLVTPDQFRQPLKAGPRTRKRKPRKLGRSLIATDTLEKNAIVIEKEKTKTRKETRIKGKNSSNARNVFQSDSEEEDFEISLQDDSNNDGMNWSKDEDYSENDENILTEKCLQKPLPRPPEEGNYVLVQFATEREKVFYVAKVLENRNTLLKLYVSFLRLKKRGQFHIPNVPDLSYVKDDDVKFILPKPIMHGSTARQQSCYKFPIDMSYLNLR